MDKPEPPHTRSAAGASLASAVSTTGATSTIKQDSSVTTGMSTRSSRTTEQRTGTPKDTSNVDSTGPGKGGVKPKKPTGKSGRRIESDSDEGKKEKTSASGTSKKRKRTEMEKEDSQVKTKTKIGRSNKWTPGYFTNKKILQVPSATVNIPGYKYGARFRSIGTQTDCSRRHYRFKGLKPVPMNIGDWSKTPMASLDFIRPKHTEETSRWIEPKEGENQGKYRFKPGTLALAEIRHYMGSEASCKKKGPAESESAFLIPHTMMKRVILELGMERLEDCRFESLAYKILHFVGEHYLTQIYQDALMLATHMKKTVVSDREMLLARRMCGDYGTYQLWGYQRPAKGDPIHLEADPDAAKSRWTYDHQEWKSKAWKQGNWDAILHARKKGGLKRLWTDQKNKSK